jgi:hypothetical protein
MVYSEALGFFLANGDPVAIASGSDTASRTSSFDFLYKAVLISNLCNPRNLWILLLPSKALL